MGERGECRTAAGYAWLFVLVMLSPGTTAAQVETARVENGIAVWGPGGIARCPAAEVAPRVALGRGKTRLGIIQDVCGYAGAIFCGGSCDAFVAELEKHLPGRATRPAQAPPPVEPARRPTNEVRICPDGSPVTAQGCPTQVLSFPGKQPSRQPPPAEAPPRVPLQAKERSQADAAFARLMSALPLPAGAPPVKLPAALEEVDDALEEGGGPRNWDLGELWRSPLAKVESFVTREAERIRERCVDAPAFNRIVCRQILNAIPPLGLGRFLAGSADNDDVGKMLDLLEAEDPR